MSSSTPEGRESDTGRLGGARADFVASLGRKVADARDLLSALEDDPSSKPARDELRRRLHALGSGARLLRFDAMARSLQDALVVLERAANAGSLREPDLVVVAQTLDDLPALAWGDVPARAGSPEAGEKADEVDESPGRPPVIALVVGGEGLTDVLLDDSGTRARSYECERTDDVEAALEMARAYAPDLVLVDGDLARAPELVEALLDDPLTEPVPIVVVGSFRAPDEGARFVALGVAKSLAKPVAPETLRSVCDEVLDAREERTVRMTLGEPTLEQLANRLSEELKRALIDGVDRAARSCRVPLGEGTEVLGALWGAIARVQEIVAQKTGGAVRFGGDAPEGTIALAPWLHQEVPGADRMAGRGRGAAADVRLHGRRVVVADDDPGVTWFISDLLRTAGCEVHEALDGRSALDMVFRVQPELVVSDILMPGLDGFGLSRALRRDVALRDTPVILLSWKEDLLQRVRELGASAAAYMRKESDSRAILARVREVLRPRARIEVRLRGDGEVRGRLDELSPRLLLELVGVIRKDARIAVRDASFLYEIEVRGGAPRKVTRTASDGSYRSGERALSSLLGVGAGRFVVTPGTEAIRGDLTGTLSDQLARPVAMARGALAATTGAATMYVERIVVDRDEIDETLRATPDPARTLIGRIVDGACPRQMLLGGDVSPALLEDVLADLAARGLVRAVEGASGTDLLTPAVDAALAVIRGAARPPSVMPPNARPSAPSLATSMRSRSVDSVPRTAPVPVLAPPESPPPPAMRPAPAAALALALSSPPPPPPSPRGEYFALELSEPPPPRVPDEDSGVPSSLEDAVMRQLSERSPFPGPAMGLPPPIVEPSELRPRSSNPPAADDEGDVRPLPSIPPDAIVPDTLGSDSPSGETIAAVPATMPQPTLPLPMPVDTRAAPVSEAKQPPRPTPLSEAKQPPRPRPSTGAMPATPVASAPAAPAPPAATTPAAATPAAATPAAATPAPASGEPAVYRSPLFSGLTLSSAVSDLTRASPPEPAKAAPPPRSAISTVPPSAVRPAAGKPSTPSKAKSPWPGLVLAFAVLGVAVATVLYVSEGDQETSERRGEPSAAVALPPSPTAPPTGRPAATAPSLPSLPLLTAVFDDIPPGAEVPAGYGLLEVTAPAGARIHVDGALVGGGSEVRTALPPGSHEVAIDFAGRESKQSFEVRAGKSTRARTAAP
jgi:CheY-like chemotaxis protein